MQDNKPAFKTVLILLTGILILSWSSIFIRMMQDLHPLTITFYRLGFSCLFLLPFAFPTTKRSVKKISSADIGFLFIAGLFLALHFYTWIYSLQLTSVGNSIFLESTHPLFAWLLSLWFLKEQAEKSFIWAGVAGLAGMFLITRDNLFNASTAFAGDSLAITSALFIAAYLIVARVSGERIPLLRYLFWVYTIAAVIILSVLLLLHIPFWSVSATNWKWLVLLALGPNLIGHSILNWASRRIAVYKVNLALLAEAVLATVYAAFLLGEVPPPNFYPGAFLVLWAVSSGIRHVFKKEEEQIG